MYKMILFLLGIVYYFIIQLSMVTHEGTSTHIVTLKSHISQKVKLHIRAKRNELKSIVCNAQRVTFPKRNRLWFERQSEEMTVALKRGDNECKVKLQDEVKTFHLIVKRKFDYVEYMVLFILLGLPIITLVFRGFLSLLEYTKKKIKFDLLVFTKIENNLKIPLYIWAILSLGMFIRIMYFNKYGIMHFQHDWQGHVEFIKHISNHWTLPLGEKGLQFPQQPLYYVLMSGIYTIGLKLGLASMEALHLLGYFALFCSFVFLYYGYKFFTLLTESKWVHTVALLFLSLTPSLVYMSARINNDVLVMALSAYTLYYSVKSYQTQFHKYFTRGLVGVTLLFLTKISTAPLEIFLFMLLIVVYLGSKDTAHIQRKLYIFSIVGLFVLGFTLLKTYLPIEQTFHMVNSSGGFRNQHIPNLGISFFLRLDIEHLFLHEYREVYMKDTSVYTFLNHQYRTMLLGEFNYKAYLNHFSGFKFIIKVILLTGMIYLLGILGYVHNLKKAKTIDIVIFFIFILNVLLIIKFVHDYPSICNTDFRYLVPTFLLFTYITVQGLDTISHRRIVKYLLTTSIGLLTLFEIIFLIEILI